jgi:hypothetical protein|nr:MAG TPA: head closure knob [Caudoviricetes sp.]
MIYNQRVILIKEAEPEDELFGDKVQKEIGPLPCQEGSLTNAEQMGIFGKYNLDSFKLHLQGVHTGLSEVIYKGRRRSIQGKKHHRNSTVIYL